MGSKCGQFVRFHPPKLSASVCQLFPISGTCAAAARPQSCTPEGEGGLDTPQPASITGAGCENKSRKRPISVSLTQSELKRKTQ